MFADSRHTCFLLVRDNQINKQKVAIKLPIPNITWFCGNQWLYSGVSLSLFSILCITLRSDIWCTKKYWPD